MKGNAGDNEVTSDDKGDCNAKTARDLLSEWKQQFGDAGAQLAWRYEKLEEIGRRGGPGEEPVASDSKP